MLLLCACASGQLPAPSTAGDGATLQPSGESAAADGWQTGAPMPTARSEMRVAVVDGIFFVPGGIRRVDRFLGLRSGARQLDGPRADAGTGPPHDGRLATTARSSFSAGRAAWPGRLRPRSSSTTRPRTHGRWPGRCRSGAWAVKRSRSEALSILSAARAARPRCSAMIRPRIPGTYCPARRSRASTWRLCRSTVSYGSSADAGAGQARWQPSRYSTRPAARGGTALK